jgi:hypothetical protein
MRAIILERTVLSLAKLHAAPVLQIGHLSPWSAPSSVSLVLRYTGLGVTLLQLHTVEAEHVAVVSELHGDPEIAVVVYADLADQITRLGSTDQFAAQIDNPGL